MHSKHGFRCILPALILVAGSLWAEEEVETPALEDQRQATLRYGIDDEVIAVLESLRSEKSDIYNDVLTEVLAQTRSAVIRQGIYDLWVETEYDGGLALAREELQDLTEDAEVSTLQSAMNYLASRHDGEAVDALMQLAGDRNAALAASAIRALGLINPDGQSGEDAGAMLLESLEEDDAEEDVTAAIIVALGELHYEAAADKLVSIARDEGAPASHRQFASVSIGRIGRASDRPILEEIYHSSNDSQLRSYALAGLAEYEDGDNTALMTQALKRDSFWRIRVTAAKKLAGVEDASELLQYKAVHDPVNHVRIAALEALGKSQNPDNQEFLREYFADEKKSTPQRLASLTTLVENQITGTVEVLHKVMDKLWDKDTGRFLEFTCRELSLSDWKALEPVYSRMIDHSNWLLQIYGIRGIRRNRLASLQEKVESLDAEGVDERVRREVKLKPQT